MSKRFSHKGLLVFLAFFFTLFVSEALSAQEYARYYHIWDKYRGTWYGSNSTVAELSREDGEEMMLYVTYKGCYYEAYLMCVSPDFATTDTMLYRASGYDSGIVATIKISASGLVTLKLYQGSYSEPFYQTAMHRRY